MTRIIDRFSHRSARPPRDRRDRRRRGVVRPAPETIVRVWWLEYYDDGRAFLGVTPPPMRGEEPRRLYAFLHGSLAFVDRARAYVGKLLPEPREPQ